MQRYSKNYEQGGGMKNIIDLSRGTVEVGSFGKSLVTTADEEV